MSLFGTTNSIISPPSLSATTNNAENDDNGLEMTRDIRSGNSSNDPLLTHDPRPSSLQKQGKCFKYCNPTGDWKKRFYDNPMTVLQGICFLLLLGFDIAALVAKKKQLCSNYWLEPSLPLINLTFGVIIYCIGLRKDDNTNRKLEEVTLNNKDTNTELCKRKIELVELRLRSDHNFDGFVDDEKKEKMKHEATNIAATIRHGRYNDEDIEAQKTEANRGEDRLKEIDAEFFASMKPENKDP